MTEIEVTCGALKISDVQARFKTNEINLLKISRVKNCEI